jgi:dGTPase
MPTEVLKEFVKHKEYELEKISHIRSKSNDIGRRDELRSNADIDYARILYSSSFRRLQGKMQLLVPGSIHFYRNRLTHSLEVAQIARSIAKRIGMSDVLTVQSCALAHDLGNPPFGHAGEIYLSSCSKEHPYEGNAQTFRILNHLEEKHHEYNGLNLTIRTLLGTVKYPFPESELKPYIDENDTTKEKRDFEKFLYKNDWQSASKWSEEHGVKLKTIDCQVMDIADEIAYAAHDLEDALRMKYFTVDDILFEFAASKYYDKHSLLEELVNDARIFARQAHTYKTSEEFSILLQKELTSAIVDRLIQDITVVNSDQGETLGYESHANLALGLKKLTFAAVKRRPDVIRYEKMGKTVIQGLYNVLTDASFNKDQVLLPAEYRHEGNLERTVLDYIGGMMDEYAIDQYKVYYGPNSLDTLYRH